MAATDIALVETWVDHGCPGGVIDSQPLIDSAYTLTATASVTGLAGPILDATADPDGYRLSKGEQRQRIDGDALKPTQVERLRCALRALYDLNRWPGDKRSHNNLALIHQNHCQHGWERFLPWQRIYLYEFEQALQDFCPDVTMPWWGFPAERYKPDDPATGVILPDAFQGFVTEASLRELRKAGDDVALRPRAARRSAVAATRCCWRCLRRSRGAGYRNARPTGSALHLGLTGGAA